MNIFLCDLNKDILAAVLTIGKGSIDIKQKIEYDENTLTAKIKIPVESFSNEDLQNIISNKWFLGLKFCKSEKSVLLEFIVN